MRLRTFAAGGMIVTLFFCTAHAAEVDEQGARTIENNLTYFLPEAIAKSGLVHVAPAGTRYQITYDFSKLLAKIDMKALTIEGLKPLDMFATPLDGGMWNVEGNNSLDISGRATAENTPPTDFSYSIGSLVSQGVFDPAISYFRSSDFIAKDIKLSSTTGADKITGSFGAMNYKLAATDNDGGKTVDFGSSGSMTAFNEEIASGTAAPVTVKADSFDIDANVKGLVIKQFRDLIFFLADHSKDEHLAPADGETFKTLMRSALPVFSSLDEKVTVNNLAVASAQGDFKVRKVDYGFQMDGVTEASRLGFSMRAEDISLASGLVPDAYAAFVPEVAEVQFGVGGLNFAGAVDATLSQADFSKKDPLSEEQGNEIAKIILPGGLLKMDFPKISAKSPVYDLEVSGKLIGHIDQTNRYSLEASILARDYDKSIAAVQEAAKNEPELTQMSFGMMMVKGFGKTDPDGRQRWDVRIDEDGTIVVNGQVLKSGAN